MCPASIASQMCIASSVENMLMSEQIPNGTATCEIREM